MPPAHGEQPHLNTSDQAIKFDELLVHPNTIVGVEMKILFPEPQQTKLLESIELWFDASKELIPVGGIEIPISRKLPDGTLATTGAGQIENLALPTGVHLTPDIIALFDAILLDSAQDPELGNLDPIFVLERTGDFGTHAGDTQYHLDAKSRLFTDDGERTFSQERSRDKYMAYVGRPETIVVHEQVDQNLSHMQGNDVANREESDRVISQLLPNKLYKVAIGDVPHSAPIHEDGLMVLASFNRD